MSRIASFARNLVGRGNGARLETGAAQAGPQQQGQQTQSTASLPPVEDPAGIPQKETVSARKIADFITDQYQNGLAVRRPHALKWLQVRAIMSGIHYYEIKGGALIPLRPKANVIRATVKMMEPAYRREIGRLNANDVGVTAMPRTGLNPNAYWRATRAEMILRQWADESRLDDVDQMANEHLMYYGMQAHMPYVDRFRKQVFVKSIPGAELMPIPYDARNWEELDGIMRVTLMTRAWLEQQDEIIERRTGQPPARKMARLASSTHAGTHVNTVTFTPSMGMGGRIDGATVIWFWIKPTPLTPQGQIGFMVEDELHRFTPSLPGGKIPMEPVYYMSKPDHFHGTGFCELLVASQLEANRQLTNVVKSAQRNAGFLIYNAQRIDSKDIVAARNAGLIALKPPTIDTREDAVKVVPPENVGRDVGAMLQIARVLGREAASHESDIILGKQEGRTEGGPATSLLDANTRAPLETLFRQKFLQYHRLYPTVLDSLAQVWPDEKKVTAVGVQNLGREQLVRRDGLPSSHEVILTPTPMLANGRNAQLAMVFQLRQMPSQDGKGFMLSDQEVKRFLELTGFAPAGLEMIDKAEQRILERIALLIGDGENPGIEPSGDHDFLVMRRENHRLATRRLTEATLEPAFRTYGQNVQRALVQQLEFHDVLLKGGVLPDNFDATQEEADMRLFEDELDFREQDPTILDGQLNINGLVVGAA